MVYGSGAQVFVGYVAEITPGVVPVTTPTYFPCEPDNVTFNFDPARQALKVGTGQSFVDFTSVELAAKGTGSLTFPLWSELGQGLLALCGLAGTSIGAPITLPQYITVYVYRVAKLFQYPGCKAKMIEITASSSKQVSVKVDFDFIARPLDIAPISPPSFTSEKPFVWGDMQPATLIGTSNIQDLDNVKITIAFNQSMFYGNHGNNLPSHLITSDIEVKGTYTELFQDATEYELFAAACQIPGAISFSWIKQCALGGGHTTPASVTFAFANCVYTQSTFKNPLKGPIVQDFGFTALSTTGSSPLTYTLVVES